MEKEYEVLLDKPFDAAKLPKLLRGMVIESGRARVERARIVGSALLQVVLRQGLKRQIRLMFLKLGYEVKRLVRTRIGPLNLGNLQPGRWRLLNEREVALLKGDDTKGS